MQATTTTHNHTQQPQTTTRSNNHNPKSHATTTNHNHKVQPQATITHNNYKPQSQATTTSHNHTQQPQTTTTSNNQNPKSHATTKSHNHMQQAQATTTSNNHNPQLQATSTTHKQLTTTNKNWWAKATMTKSNNLKQQLHNNRQHQSDALPRKMLTLRLSLSRFCTYLPRYWLRRLATRWSIFPPHSQSTLTNQQVSHQTCNLPNYCCTNRKSWINNDNISDGAWLDLGHS